MSDEPLRVVQVTGTDAGGGAELAVGALHSKLNALGHRSLLLVGRKCGTSPDVIEIPRRTGPKGLLRATRWLERTLGLQYLYAPGFRRIEELIPPETQVLHLHSLHGVEGYADVGMVPRLSRRWPTVMTMPDMWMMTGHCAHAGPCQRWRSGCGRCPDLTLYPAIPRDGTRINWLRKRHALKRSWLTIVAPSEWLARLARESPLLEGCPIHVVPNPVDTAIFHTRRDRRAARRDLGLPDDKIVVLLTANLLELPWKGVVHGIEALNQLADPSVLTLMVGNGAETLARRVTGSVVALPYQQDRAALADCYRAADLLLMPSLEEVFGMVAAEAMACGTPVVAYATGGLPEVLGEDGGVLAPRHDVRGLAQALEGLVRSPERRLDLGRRAAERSARCFDLENHARHIVRVYREALGRFGARRGGLRDTSKTGPGAGA